MHVHLSSAYLQSKVDVPITSQTLKAGPLRLGDQMTKLLVEMDAVYTQLTDKLSEVTVNPESMDKFL